MIRNVAAYINIPLIVGGGIRSKEQASKAASAGANIIVTGNVFEGNKVKNKISEIIEGIHKSRHF
jgi:heptaprenylglyceryl phosphate synthase